MGVPTLPYFSAHSCGNKKPCSTYVIGILKAAAVDWLVSYSAIPQAVSAAAVPAKHGATFQYQHDRRLGGKIRKQLVNDSINGKCLGRKTTNMFPGSGNGEQE